MATGIDLLQEAIYGLVPNLLAKGNLIDYISSVDSTTFPLFCNGVPQVSIGMENMPSPYGYSPLGYIRLKGGTVSPSSFLKTTNIEIPSVCTIYLDVRASQPTQPKGISFHLNNPAYQDLSNFNKGMKINMYNSLEGAGGVFKTELFSPFRENIYTFQNSASPYPVRDQRSLVINGDTVLYKFLQEPILTAHPDPLLNYPEEVFTNLIIGTAQEGDYNYFEGRVYCLLVWDRALTSDELTWLHTEGLEHFYGIKATTTDGVVTISVDEDATPKVTTTYPPAALTGKALLESAAYGLLPQLLAKGNKNTAQTVGAFPSWIKPGRDMSLFTLLGGEEDGGMSDGYGYNPEDGGSLSFDGATCYIKNYHVDIPSDNMSIFIDVEAEVCEEAWTGGGPFGVVYRLGEEGSEDISQYDFELSHRSTNQIRHDMYLTEEFSTYSLSFPQRYCMTVGFSNSSPRIYRQINSIKSAIISSTFDNPFEKYNIFDIGSRNGWGFFKGKIRALLIFPRTLYQEEIDWLHTQSRLGFPSFYANEVSGEIEIFDSAATTTNAPVTTPSAEDPDYLILLREAKYGVFPSLLSKISIPNQETGYFPTYFGNGNPSTLESVFQLKNMVLPYSGFSAALGHISFQPSDTSSMGPDRVDIDSGGEGFTIFYDLTVPLPGSIPYTVFKASNSTYSTSRIIVQHKINSILNFSYGRTIVGEGGSTTDGLIWTGPVYEVSDSSQIVTSINLARVSNGVVLLRPGSYSFNGATIDGSCCIMAENPNSVTLTMTGGFYCSTNYGEIVEFKNLMFVGGRSGVIPIDMNSGTLVVRNCKFSKFGANRTIQSSYGRIDGLISNCQFVTTDSMTNGIATNLIRGDHRYSWNRPLIGLSPVVGGVAGTLTDALFIEDCTYTCGDSYTVITNDGARIVFRRNKCYVTVAGTDKFCDSHGQQYDSSKDVGWSTRLWVIHDNDFIINSGATCYRGLMMRGGIAVVESNTFSGSFTGGPYLIRVYEQNFDGTGAVDKSQRVHLYLHGNKKNGVNCDTTSDNNLKLEIYNGGVPTAGDNWIFGTCPDVPMSAIPEKHPFMGGSVVGVPVGETVERPHSISSGRYRCALVYKEGVATVYTLNETGTVDVYNFKDSYSSVLNRLEIGVSGTSEYLNGQLRCFAIFDRSLTNTEIALLFSACATNFPNVAAQRTGVGDLFVDLIKIDEVPTTTTLPTTTTEEPELTTTEEEPIPTTTLSPTWVPSEFVINNYFTFDNAASVGLLFKTLPYYHYWNVNTDAVGSILDWEDGGIASRLQIVDNVSGSGKVIKFILNNSDYPSTTTFRSALSGARGYNNIGGVCGSHIYLRFDIYIPEELLNVYQGSLCQFLLRDSIGGPLVNPHYFGVTIHNNVHVFYIADPQGYGYHYIDAKELSAYVNKWITFEFLIYFDPSEGYFKIYADGDIFFDWNDWLEIGGAKDYWPGSQGQWAFQFGFETSQRSPNLSLYYNDLVIAYSHSQADMLMPTTTAGPSTTVGPTTTAGPTTTVGPEVTTTEVTTTPEIYGITGLNIYTYDYTYAAQNKLHVYNSVSTWGMKQFTPDDYFDKEDISDVANEAVKSVLVTTNPLIVEEQISILHRTQEGKGVIVPFFTYSASNLFVYEILFDKAPAIDVTINPYIGIDRSFVFDEEDESIILNRRLDDPTIIVRTEIYASGARVYMLPYGGSIVFEVLGKALGLKGQKNTLVENYKEYNSGIGGSGEYSYPNNILVQTDELAYYLASKTLELYVQRKGVKIKGRGDPSLEVGDGFSAPAYYRASKTLPITYKRYYVVNQSLTYDGGLDITTEGRAI
jgi:hypothetical protein